MRLEQEITDPIPILLVDDERTSRALVKAALARGPFVLHEATDGEAALALIQEHPPQLVICDYRMPGMDGVALIRLLKSDAVHRHLPIIMLTSHGSTRDTVAGLECGADDYLTKPFRPAELRTRVLSQLRRRERDLWSDPLTLLPSGHAIHQELERRIGSGEAFAVIHADLDHFKPFADKFGFLRAGAVVSATASHLTHCVRDRAGDDGFVGHIAGDDFLAICSASVAQDVCQDFIARFDRAAPSFYEEADLERGFIQATDRDGNPRRFPLLSISLGIVDSRRHPITSAAAAAEFVLRAKQAAKARPGSSSVMI